MWTTRTGGADLEEQYPDLSEQERMELMVEQNNDYLDDERCNLNIQLSRPILLIAEHRPMGWAVSRLCRDQKRQYPRLPVF